MSTLVSDFAHHLIFTLNTAILTGLIVWFVARASFPSRPRDQRRVLLASVIVVATRVAFVVLFNLALPERGLSPDETRYLFEMQQIASAPWAWNPFTGTGPYYYATPKMGMSYLYGIIMFIHGIDSLYAVLVLNVVFGLLTALTVFFLTARLSYSLTPAYLAMLLTAVYPETLFWTARVTRENLTLFLVPALIYACIRLYETSHVWYLVYATAAIGSLLLVRAQLVMFTILIVGYFGFRTLRGEKRIRALSFFAVAIVLLYAGFSLFEAQIRRAAGNEALRLLSLDPGFWASQGSTFLWNLGGVLTPVARGSYGTIGLLMIPFALAVSVLLLLTVIRFRRIFVANITAAGLLFFLSLCFLMALALVGRINIRFRSTVAPLLLSLISVSAHYYWVRWRLPRVRLWSSPGRLIGLGPGGTLTSTNSMSQEVAGPLTPRQ